MNVKFVKISADDYAVIEKDPGTFYYVSDDSPYVLQVGLYKDGVLLKTYEELQELGLDIEKDYSDDPNDKDYYLNPDSGSAANVLDNNDLEGELVIPDNTAKIGDNALRDSQKLQAMSSPSNGHVQNGTVTVPNGIGSIGDNAFSGTQTASANVPSSVGSVSPTAFADTPAAQNNNVNIGGHPIQNAEVDLENNDSATITLEKGYAYKVTALYGFNDDVTGQSTIESSDPSIVRFIPECFLKAEKVGHAVISGTYITALGAKKYAEIECNVVDDGSGINVHIPGEVVRENETFYSYDEVTYCLDCGHELSRTTVTLEPGLYTSSGDFLSWDELLSLKYVATNPMISTEVKAGSQFEQLEGTLIIPSTINGISNTGFKGCDQLTAIYIPDTVTWMGSDTYMSCDNLSDVYLSEKEKEVPSNCFRDCISLKSIKMSDLVTSIGSNAFMNCASLSNITLPSSLQTLWDYSFGYCSALTEITLPASLQKIYASAFVACNNLATINFAGTKTQWNAVRKDSGWISRTSPVRVVHCTDGNVAITY